MNALARDSLVTLLKRLLIGALVLVALIMMGLGITHADENDRSADITPPAANGS